MTTHTGDEGPDHGARPQQVISIPDPVIVRDLVDKLQVPAHSVIATLLEHNYLASLSAEIDFATAAAVCARYGFVARKVI